MGIQFDELFTGNLYLNISRNAIEMAEQLKRLLHDKNYTFYLESPTNQQFVIMENEKLEELKKHVAVSFGRKPMTRTRWYGWRPAGLQRFRIWKSWVSGYKDSKIGVLHRRIKQRK